MAGCMSRLKIMFKEIETSVDKARGRWVCLEHYRGEGLCLNTSEPPMAGEDNTREWQRGGMRCQRRVSARVVISRDSTLCCGDQVTSRRNSERNYVPPRQ